MNEYHLSTDTKIDFVVNYCLLEMKNRVNALMSMVQRKVQDERQEMQ